MTAGPALWPAARALLPLRGSLRLRLTLLYSGLFVVSGAALLTFTYLLLAPHLGTFAIGVYQAPAHRPPARAAELPVPPVILQARAATLLVSSSMSERRIT